MEYRQIFFNILAVFFKLVLSLHSGTRVPKSVELKHTRFHGTCTGSDCQSQASIAKLLPHKVKLFPNLVI